MKISKGFLPAAAVMASMAMAGFAQAADKPNMAHAHMGHVTTGWKDTPEGQGLLPVAQAEAKVAVLHAGNAARKTDDLNWMKMHIRHVLHAVDPSVEAKGPGAGYGVKKAAAGAAQHIGFAAAADGASPSVKAHAVHVSTSALNTVKRADEIIALGGQVLQVSDAAAAAALVVRISALTDQLEAGFDADGDGKITWNEGEGGLAEAAKHMGFMRKGEGLS